MAIRLPSVRMGQVPITYLLVFGLLFIHITLLAWSAVRHSPVTVELGHLPAGISHWKFGRFDLYRVNPPLVRLVAALPVLAVEHATDWDNYSVDPLVRREASIGIAFVKANGSRTFWLYTLGRWACIPFSLAGAIVCFMWGRDLYGARSGLAAMALWCFCPNILGNGSLLMPDVPAAALCAAACYTFWRWLRNPAWDSSVGAAVALGAAELTKTTLLVLFLLWPVFWLFYRLIDRRQFRSCGWMRGAAMLVAQMLISIYIINLGYGFQGTFQRLGTYRFKCHLLTGDADDNHFRPGNRFSETWLASVPVPLPRDYVQGIDSQKLDFERGMRSYLRGQWSDSGWWYYYIYALAIKVPLGTWSLVVLGSTIVILPNCRTAFWRDESFVLFPLVVILTFVSSQTGFSIHFRYVLPIFPFLFVWGSRAFCPQAPADNGAHAIRNNCFGLRISFRVNALVRRVIGIAFPYQHLTVILSTVALIWSIASSMLHFPHSLSYFNEIVGGPQYGHEHLLDSNIAWGQDMLYLKEWYDSHLQARPLYSAIQGLVDPRIAGIESEWPSLDVSSSASGDAVNERLRRPKPGWYAIDVNYLHGSDRLGPDGNGGFRSFDQHDPNIEYLREMRPLDVVGYTIYLYRVLPN